MPDHDHSHPTSNKPQAPSHTLQPTSTDITSDSLQRIVHSGSPLTRQDVRLLQRTLGNRATARLLTQRQAQPTATPKAPPPSPQIRPDAVLNWDFVQRKVGFEFEADAWLSYLVQRPMTPAEQNIRETDVNAVNATATTAGGFTAPPKKGHVIQSIGTGMRAGPGTGFELQADEKSADSGDLEFVTKPFEETAQGYEDLKSTLGMMRSLMNHIVSLPLRSKLGSYVWPDEHGLGATVLLRFGDRPMKVKPQVTGGIGLDKIGSVMQNMGVVPNESKEDAEKRKGGRGQGGLLAANSTMAKILGFAPAAAKSAIQFYLPAYETNWNLLYKNDFENTGILEGLVSLATAYIKAGVNIEFASYPKVLAPLMSRTDFATLFTMLPPAQQSYFVSKPSVFVNLVLAAVNSNFGFSKKDAMVSKDSPVIQHFVKNGTEVLKTLKVERWLTGITNKTDYLTIAGFQQMLKEDTGNDVLSKENIAASEELEGFGALGNKTDGGNAIVEFRGIPAMLTHPEVEPFALNFHKYIQNLNSKPAGSVFYGKQT